jgi:hypothetical protein
MRRPASGLNPPRLSVHPTLQMWDFLHPESQYLRKLSTHLAGKARPGLCWSPTVRALHNVGLGSKADLNALVSQSRIPLNLAYRKSTFLSSVNIRPKRWCMRGYGRWQQGHSPRGYR